MEREREDDLDREVEELEEAAEKVDRDIDETRREWEAKQESGGVPGAVEPEEADKDEG